MPHFVARYGAFSRGAASMSKKSPSNHGEGNPEAAEHFNTAEKEFVNSPRGKQKIQEGAHVRPDEEAELKAAEERARAHGKNDDSATRGFSKGTGKGA
jgi:hypothetical protein